MQPTSWNYAVCAAQLSSGLKTDAIRFNFVLNTCCAQTKMCPSRILIVGCQSDPDYKQIFRHALLT